MQTPLKRNHSPKAGGARLTAQRRLVFQILEECPGHLDAETIYQEAHRRGARISLATVYRALAALKEAGLIEEHRLGEDHAHFERIQKGPHHHFTCLACRRVIEFEAPPVLAAVRRLSEQEGFLVTGIHLDLEGYCASCRETGPEKQS